MEVTLNNSQASGIEFPSRKMRNRNQENFNPSKATKVYLEKQTVFIDGTTGDVTLKYKVPSYLKASIMNGDIKIDGSFFDYQTEDKELEELLDQNVQRKFGTRDLSTIDPLLLIQAGLLHI